jgi:hypothetical protein
MAVEKAMLRDADTPLRNQRPPPPGSPAALHPTEFGERRIYLDRLRIHHIDLTRRFVSVADGALYPTDLLLTTVMARSYSLVEGFVDAFDMWNPIVAAPLLRMQIDSLVRVSYTARMANSDEVTMYVLKGGQFRHLKDEDGKSLTDRRLLEHARPAHPWVNDVYTSTSGWVHLSPEHLWATVRLIDHGNDTSGAPDVSISAAVPLSREHIPISAMQELLAAMTRATEELFGYIETWESRKGLPPGQTRLLGG